MNTAKPLILVPEARLEFASSLILQKLDTLGFTFNFSLLLLILFCSIDSISSFNSTNFNEKYQDSTRPSKNLRLLFIPPQQKKVFGFL